MDVSSFLYYNNYYMIKAAYKKLLAICCTKNYLQITPLYEIQLGVIVRELKTICLMF